MVSKDTFTLSPSIDMQTAATTPWDIVVVGAGPAGTAMAARAATKKLRVLFIDRSPLPRPKVCGCCLSPLALAELSNLSKETIPQFTVSTLSLTDLTIVSQGYCASVPYATGGVLSRISLDTCLAKHAIAANAAWLPNTRAVSCKVDQVTVTLTVQTTSQSQHAIQTKRLILAGGLRDAIRMQGDSAVHRPPRNWPRNNRIGLGTTLCSTGGAISERHLVMAVGSAGYCGLVRLEDGSIDVAAAVHPSLLKRGATPAEALSRLLAETFQDVECPIDTSLLQGSGLLATPQLTHHTGHVDPQCTRILRVGDAVGYIEPFTGEGIGWALLSARLAMEALIDIRGDLRPSQEASRRYRQTYGNALNHHHRRCRMVSLALRSPFFVSTAVRAAACFPTIASSIARTITGNT
ncbi:MAG: FAD-dependent oxidoreductase [Planctomycetaceae bacterium]|nr:FAD-dependent oxidoreductase [Planctomycetaceae bacterium]MBT6458722.1 FAD-dependent oxidoreductase [Planctomycetaceae bacterium]